MPETRRPNVDPAPLFDALCTHVAAVCGPGVRALALKITLPEGPSIRLRVPPGWEPVHEDDAEPFSPNPFQKMILDKLEGKSLTADTLAHAVGCNRRTLYKPGGLNDLTEHGLVRNSREWGYYRPDRPPPNLV